MSGDEGAAGALIGAVAAALRAVEGLTGVSDGAPVRAGDAHAVIEAGPETDWGHKSGAGAEIRFAVLIRCGGERPGRARGLIAAARERLVAMGPDCGGWRIVTLALMRARVVATPPARGTGAGGPGWTGIAEYRARLLRVENV